ncbi:hypothetical protein VNO78_34332 [Psophocarpus tetragonolobus]|uniref:Uncharacterized protein n=1 Tax=Psophocarpus tetragonolobus TaxID=3891 RepID=A0AAN9P0D3_PSOTE
MQETSLSQLDEWKGKTRKERRKSGKVEKHALVSEKPTIPSLRARMKKNKGKEVVVGVEERKVLWSVLHTNPVSHQKEILMDGEIAVE